MGHSSSKPDPSLESLRVLLRSRGLELTDSQVIKTWETLVKVAPWLPASNVFDWETWDRVEQRVRKAQVNHGDIPPLGTFPTLAALKSCFPSWPSKPAAKNLIDRETTGSGAPSWGDSDPLPQAESTPAGQESHKEPDENRGNGALNHFDATPWPPKSTAPLYPPLPGTSSSSKPFKSSSAPPPQYKQAGVSAPLPYKVSCSPIDRQPQDNPLFHPQPNPGPCQLFPVNVNPGGNCPAPWYPWEPGDLKELKKAILEDGPNAP